jgi:hypothetical protein
MKTIIRRLFYSLLLLLILLSVTVPLPVLAQKATSMRVNSYQIVEGADSMDLSIFVTLFDDATGKAITGGSIKDAQISFLDMDKKYPAAVKQADTPFYIALIMDSSGSMLPVAKKLREAAKQAISSPPLGAQFAIYQFDEQLQLIHDFTANKDVLASAIDKVQPRYGKSTCLYDSAYDTIDILSKAPAGRKAVILFTDGKDEKSGGGICSKHGYDQVVAFANTPGNPTPINTIGLSGNAHNVNATELQNMAATTGGFSAIGSEDSLNDIFKQVMDALNSQWLVEAKVYPTVGKHSAVVQLTLADGTPFSGTISIESTKPYTVPPDPVSLNLDGMEYSPSDDTFTVKLSVVSPQLVNELKISMWNSDNGLKVSDNTFTDLTKNHDFKIPSTGLEAGKKYQLHIEPFDKSGKNFTNDKGENLVIIHDFSYQPQTATAALNIDSVSIEPKTLVLSLTSKGLDKVKSYTGWINNEDTNARVPDSEFNLPVPAAGTPLKVPVDKVPAGKYTVVLQAMDDKQQLMTTGEYKGLVYAPVSPNIFAVLASGFIAAPIIILFIVAILVGVMYWLMRGNKQNKARTGTPVMQGNLEVPLSSKPGEFKELPISETIIMEKPRSAPAAPGAANRSISAPNQPRAALSIKASPMQEIRGKAFMINQSPFTLGRGKDNHLMILDGKISRKHAQIIHNPGNNTYMLIDLNSDNGTWVNGNRVVSNAPAVLQNGMVIQLGGDTQIVFQVLA